MRIQVASDLHLEFEKNLKFRMNPANRDVLVLAGDVHLDDAAERFISRELRYSPVVYIAGNHEFYHGNKPEVMERLKDMAARYEDLYFLDGESVVIGDVTFVGGTLWTNFNGNDFHAKEACARGMNDYYIIGNGDRPWTPDDAYAEHVSTLAKFDAALKARYTDKVVVASHMAPHLRSLDGRYERATTNPSYASDLSSFIDQHQPNLWCHGHVHCSKDYFLGETNVVCNPRGYVGYEVNSAFEDDLIVEI